MTKKTVFFIALLITGALAFSNTVSFQDDNYTGTVTYNETARPGDAVFARMNVKISKTLKKKNAPDTAASLILMKGNRKIDSAQFYFFNQKAKKQPAAEMLASIPVSLWTDPDSHYSLKIIFTAGVTPEKEIILPFEVEARSFNSEVLDLDERNSGIKQNMTAERMAQIEKLNNILETVMPQDIYSLKPFVRPVKSERMTAYFGDKRVYKYTDGQSETSYHYGHDYGVPEKTDVYACADGRVVMSEFRISTGWSIVIEHLPGLYSLYYHLSSPDVQENDFVRQGQKIGLSGSTGLATGPHLHWEVRLNAAAVTPDFFMRDFTFSSSDGQK